MVLDYGFMATTHIYATTFDNQSTPISFLHVPGVLIDHDKLHPKYQHIIFTLIKKRDIDM